MDIVGGFPVILFGYAVCHTLVSLRADMAEPEKVATVVINSHLAGFAIYTSPSLLQARKSSLRPPSFFDSSSLR